MQSQASEYTQQRVYFTLIEKVGTWNMYQLYLFFIFLTISIIQGSLLFNSPYIFHAEPYHCDGTISEQCTRFVCSLPQSQRTQYQGQSSFNSLADDLKVDFRCEYASTLTLFSTVVFVSLIASMFLFTTFTEGFGRKNSLMLSSTMILLGVIITLLSGKYASIHMAIIGILLTYGGSENSFQYIYCYSAEVISQRHRVLFTNVIVGLYGVGILLNAVAFGYVKEWTTIYLYFIFLPTFLVLISTFFIIQKTPADLLSTEQPRKIINTLDKIAHMNGIQNKNTQQEVRQIKEKYVESIKSSDSSNHSISIIDLFRYPSLRTLTLTLFFLNFYSVFLFTSPAIINNSISTSIFKESVIDSVSYSVSVFISYFILQYFPRKFISIVLCLLAILLQCILLPFSDHKESASYIIVYFIFRIVITTSGTVIYQLNFESFPTQVRGMGAKFVILFGFSTGLIQPQLVVIFRQNQINIIYLFMIVTAIGIIPSNLIKETFQVPPPQVIKELQQAKSMQDH